VEPAPGLGPPLDPIDLANLEQARQRLWAGPEDPRQREQDRSVAEARARFMSRLLDRTAQPFALIDFEGRFIYANRAYTELTGYSAEELKHLHIRDLTSPLGYDITSAALARSRATGAAVRYEKEYFRKDGRVVPVEVIAEPFLDEQDQPRGFFAFVKDMTERKKTEAALVASERRVRALFEGIEDAVFVHDLDGRILDANPAACRRLGYTRAELLSLTTRDIDDPEFAVGFTDRLRKQIEQGHASFEGRHRTKDGRVIPVDINTSVIQLEDQKVILAVMRDLTERLALEETRRQFAEAQVRNAQVLELKNRELTRSEARYRRLTEGCLDAVVVADAQGRISLFNPAAEAIFGYQAQEVLGQPLTVLIPEELREAHHQGFQRYLEARRPRLVGRTVELCGRRKSGETFPLELSLNAVDVEGEIQFIGSIRDQTERQRMRAVLAQTERLASIGLLSAGVAHEINNPLSYVANNLAVIERDLKGVRAMIDVYESTHDLLAQYAPDRLDQVRAIRADLDWSYVRDNLDRMIQRTREGVQRVASIVHNLRGLARTSPPKMEEAYLPDLLAGALEMVQGRLRRRNITVETSIEPHLPRVTCVSNQISQVFLNLLVNAAQAIETAACPEGGRIQVAIRTVGDEQILEFVDNGCGIDPANLPHLFDPFFTTKPVGEGTGLGLSISHGIVTGHGGRIEVESQPGHGACFRVALPIKPGQSTGAAGPRPTAPGAAPTPPNPAPGASVEPRSIQTLARERRDDH
jgi:two-component system NtrC family sensor kinase